MHSIKAYKQKSNRKWNKSKIVLVSICLLLTLTIGGTLSFLIDTSDEAINTFTPSKVTTEIEENCDGNIKKDVSIKNTGNIKAYIRAAIVVTWKNSEGAIAPVTPVIGTDYTINWGDKWIKGSDDFYYWTSPVEPGENTDFLITSCSPVEGKAPEGYSLNVEILGSGIQADGVTSEEIPVVQETWKVVTIGTDNKLVAL